MTNLPIDIEQKCDEIIIKENNERDIYFYESGLYGEAQYNHSLYDDFNIETQELITEILKEYLGEHAPDCGIDETIELLFNKHY